MSKTNQEDLLQEVLNRDKDYVSTRNKHQKEFKNKILPNGWFDSVFNFMQNRTSRYAVSFFIGVLLFSGFAYISNRNLLNNINQVTSSNENSNNDSAQFLSITEKSLTDQKMEKKSTQSQSSGNENKATTNNQSISSPVQSPNSLSTDNTDNSQVQPPQNQVTQLQATVKDETGFQNVNFSYNLQTKLLTYSGTVMGPDGCSYISQSSLESVGENFVLEYKLGKKGEICTMIVIELPVNGSKQIELTPNQQSNFSKIFSIKQL